MAQIISFLVLLIFCRFCYFMASPLTVNYLKVTFFSARNISIELSINLNKSNQVIDSHTR